MAKRDFAGAVVHTKGNVITRASQRDLHWRARDTRNPLTSMGSPIRRTRLNLRQRMSLLGLPMVLATSVLTSWTPLVRDVQAAGSCPDNSTWGVKVGSDAQATQIDLNATPTPITVFQLANIPLPSPINHRVSPVENTVYKTTAIMNAGEPHIEHDFDTHIGFNDGQAGVPGHYAIAEIPDIVQGPVPTCSVFYSGIVRAHQQLDAWTAASNHGPTPATVVITGVGFFDGNTGQSDQSPNQIELHSVLNLNINPGTITGRVTGPGPGAASVTDGVDPAVTTASDGTYTIPNVAAGASYTVTASASGFNTQANPGVAVGYASTNTQNFALTPTAGAGAISGTVTNASAGLPIANATVTDSGGASTSTNSSGIYTLAGLAAGNHTLTATASTFNSGTQMASVTAGQTTPNVNFLLTPGQGSTPQLVQTAGATETALGTVLTATFPSATAAGHLLVLSASQYTGATVPISSITDTGNNTWTRIGTYFVAGVNSEGELWYAANANSVTSVTVHATKLVAFEVQDFSGVTTTSPLDGSVGASGGLTSASSGAVTPTASTDLMVGFIAGHANRQAITVTTAGPYTTQPQLLSDATGSTVATLVTGYRVLSAASAQTMTGTFPLAMNWASGIAAFKAAPGTTGGVS
ncbi:MAG TPA: carboxypeptidase regulatory-like domain-containing protein, partial [Candidatus Dormibacteraeota bacterium]|nr:carboxypeptidase regulatory-like domain-containing protein [Candidatus Dormibacteraeota bacterium]